MNKWYLQPMRPQFVDINHSDDYLLKHSRIWRELIPTMACQSKIFARVQLDDETRAWAVLPGWFTLMVVGHSFSEIPDQADNNTLRRMSGNAFSICSAGPQLMGFFASWRNPLLSGN